MNQKFKINFLLFLLVFSIFSCKTTFSQTTSTTNNDVKPVIDSSKFKQVADLQGSLHSIAQNETPSVVFIGTEKNVTVPYGDPFDFFFNNPFGNEPKNKKKQQQQQFKQSGLGSGVIYQKKDNNYFIMTNNHVIEGADSIKVTIDQKKFYEGKVIGADPEIDIAIVKIESKEDLIVAKFGDSDKMQVGDFVIAIGNPFGLYGTMTFGIVSAIGRSDVSTGKANLTNFIQTDAAINPGNSGGPLINIDGEVIGINTMIYSQSGGNVGIGFAIPINIANKIADEVINNGKSKIDHGYLGVFFEELKEETIKTLGLKTEYGMLVSKVIEGSPAEKFGIKVGDVILEANGKKLYKSSELTMTVANSKPGEKLSFKILRDGNTITKEVTLGNRNDMNLTETKDVKSLENYGIDVAELTPNIKDKAKIPADLDGVIITNVQQQSRAAGVGIEEGDIIFKVNNRRIKNIDDLTKILEENKDRQNYFFIFRQGKEFIVIM